MPVLIEHMDAIARKRLRAVPHLEFHRQPSAKVRGRVSERERF